MEYILLICGFVLLIKGADYFVDGAASVAYRFHISSTIVGLTIVALGTSLPEAAVSISASLAGSNELALSNVVGSNIFNTLVVVGCSAILAPFVIERKVIQRDLGFNIGCTCLLLGLVFLGHGLERWEGLILLAVLVCYLAILIKDTLKDSQKMAEEETAAEEEKILPVWKSLIFLVLGAAAIMLGGNITVSSARTIAAFWGMSETLIGLTIVSIGTSLPELVTSVVAAKKGESGLSLGNAIGSNIMNILFILGMSASIHPLMATTENMIDMVILACIALVLYVALRHSPKMDRSKGLVMVAAYVAYMIYIIIR